MMKVTFKGTEYEIPYDYDSWRFTEAIDSTFDYGYIESQPLEGGGTLDFSRRIPRDLDVELEIDGETFYLATGETQVDKLTYSGNIRYLHRINLVSRTKVITKYTLENMTLKQPKGDLGTYTRSVNNITAPIDMTSSGAVNETVTAIPTYVNVINDNPSVVDGLEIKVAKLYNISLISELSQPAGIFSTNITIRIKYNNSVIATNVATIPAKFFKSSTITDVINLKLNITTLSTFSVEYEYATSLQETKTIENSSLTISAVDVIDKPIRTYAQLVDKMLRNTEYVLSPKSRSRLNLTAPEGKFEGYSLFDGLQKLGGQLGALVRQRGTILERYWSITNIVINNYEGDNLYDFNPYDYEIGDILKIGSKYYINAEGTRIFKQINFDFFDEPNIVEIKGERDRTEIAEYEDYVSALELNTKNVIKLSRHSPYKGGFGKLRRLDGIGQMTTDNIGYITEDMQERITKVLIKGYAMKNSDSSKTWPSTTEVDITDRVVEKRQWDTFLSQADYTFSGKQQHMKNNSLYYIQGDNKIYGISYYGETEGRVIGDADVTRALYETILAKMSVLEGERIYGDYAKDDMGIDNDLNIEMQIIYENQTESRARVYKKDQSGFEKDLVKYINESSNVNETQAIGDYAQLLVNRLGGTKIIVNGEVESLSDLAKVGDVTPDGKVYTVISRKPSGNRFEYTYTLVNDFNIISSYIGVNSRHRVEEISSDSTTRRTLRYTSKLIFTDSLKQYGTRIFLYDNIFEHLFSTLDSTNLGLNYGYLECNLSNGDTKKVHMSIDTDSKGTTIEIKWKMPDNYSAGLKRYSYNNGTNTVYMNTEVPYTDFYGKVSDILFGIYDQPTIIDMDLYPEATNNAGDKNFTIITDVVDKDSDEKLSGLVEIAILSENDKIRVYNGFAKYNGLLGGTNRIKAVALNYVPLIKDEKILLSKTKDITVSGTIDYGHIDIDFTLTSSAKGIAFYNIDTLDFILTYIEELPAGSNSITLPYYIEDSLWGGGINFVTNIVLESYYYGELTQLTGVIQNIEATVDSSVLATLGQDEYGISNVVGTIMGDIQQLTGIIQSLEASIYSNIVETLGQDEYGNIYIISNVLAEMTKVTGVIVSLEAYVDSSVDDTTSGSQIIYEWVYGGSQETIGQTCAGPSDIGNVKKETTTYTSCSWVATSNVYFSATNLTTNPSCGQGVEKTTCTFQSELGVYSCRDYEGNVTTTTYDTYYTCQVVEEEV